MLALVEDAARVPRLTSSRRRSSWAIISCSSLRCLILSSIFLTVSFASSSTSSSIRSVSCFTTTFAFSWTCFSALRHACWSGCETEPALPALASWTCCCALPAKYATAVGCTLLVMRTILSSAGLLFFMSSTRPPARSTVLEESLLLCSSLIRASHKAHSFLVLCGSTLMIASQSIGRPCCLCISLRSVS